MSEHPGSFVLDINAANGVPFRVVLYEPGVAGPYPAAKDDQHPLVEFYDRRYPHTVHGQFTGGRYYLTTLLEGDQRLDLYGGEPAWSIDSVTMQLIRAWLRHMIDRSLVIRYAAGRITLTPDDLAAIEADRDRRYGT